MQMTKLEDRLIKGQHQCQTGESSYKTSENAVLFNILISNCLQFIKEKTLFFMIFDKKLC